MLVTNGTNAFHGYKYATSADVLEKVNAARVKHGIAVAVNPEIISQSDITNAKGNIEHLAVVKVTVSLFDKDSEEVLRLAGLGSGPAAIKRYGRALCMDCQRTASVSA